MAETTEWDFDDGKKVEVGELQALCEKMFEARKIADEIKQKHSEAVKEWRELETKILTILQDNAIPNFSFGDGKKVSLRKQYNLDLPKDPDNFDALQQYVVENGDLETFIKWNKTNLKTYINNKRAENGDEWLPPGVEEPELGYTLSMGGFRK